MKAFSIFLAFGNFGFRLQERERAQQDEYTSRYVDMVQLNVAVTDNKGNYITGLKPIGFRHNRRQIPQKIATAFGEGNELYPADIGGYDSFGRTLSSPSNLFNRRRKTKV